MNKFIADTVVTPTFLVDEVPNSPDLIIDTQNNSIDECEKSLMEFILTKTSIS